jgi:hypothetical protein
MGHPIQASGKIVRLGKPDVKKQLQHCGRAFSVALRLWGSR